MLQNTLHLPLPCVQLLLAHARNYLVIGLQRWSEIVSHLSIISIACIACADCEHCRPASLLENDATQLKSFLILIINSPVSINRRKAHTK